MEKIDFGKISIPKATKGKLFEKISKYYFFQKGYIVWDLEPASEIDWGYHYEQLYHIDDVISVEEKNFLYTRVFDFLIIDREEYNTLSDEGKKLLRDSHMKDSDLRGCRTILAHIQELISKVKLETTQIRTDRNCIIINYSNNHYPSSERFDINEIFSINNISLPLHSEPSQYINKDDYLRYLLSIKNYLQDEIKRIKQNKEEEDRVKEVIENMRGKRLLIDVKLQLGYKSSWKPSKRNKKRIGEAVRKAREYGFVPKIYSFAFTDANFVAEVNSKDYEEIL